MRCNIACALSPPPPPPPPPPPVLGLASAQTDYIAAIEGIQQALRSSPSSSGGRRAQVVVMITDGELPQVLTADGSVSTIYTRVGCGTSLGTGAGGSDGKNGDNANIGEAVAPDGNSSLVVDADLVRACYHAKMENALAQHSTAPFTVFLTGNEDIAGDDAGSHSAEAAIKKQTVELLTAGSPPTFMGNLNVVQQSSLLKDAATKAIVNDITSAAASFAEAANTEAPCLIVSKPP